MSKKARPKAIQDYWTRVAASHCIICGRPATIHHCHGGSMRFRGVSKGVGLKTNDWLVIPLCHDHHQGASGVDSSQNSVLEWERRFNTQVYYIDQLIALLGVDVWELSKPDEVLPKIVKRRT